MGGKQEYIPLPQYNEAILDDQTAVIEAQQDADILASEKRQGRQRWQRLLLALLLGVLFSGALGLLTQKAIAVVSRPKIAFVTLLSGDEKKLAHQKADDDDSYFVATRLLTYQLLHDPKTRNRLGAPLIVMTTPSVSKSKLERLKKDGATIWPITEPLRPAAYNNFIHNRYSDVWSKLLVWQWTQFNRILFLDNDVILSEPLDDLFKEPQVALFPNRNNASNIRKDEIPQPSEYLYAPIAEMYYNHDYPLKEGQWQKDYPNAGFFALKPSKQMFDYFMSVLSVPGKFDAHYPEQNFLNYVFRQDGNMPWQMLDNRWCTHRPTFKDVEGGVMAIHDKWWRSAGEFDSPLDPKLSWWMRAWRWKMEGYFEALERN